MMFHARAPEIDMLELESLFSAVVLNSDQDRRSIKFGLARSEKVQLVGYVFSFFFLNLNLSYFLIIHQSLI